MHSEPYVHSLGALTGMQAMQMVKGGLKAIYCSGWQVAADANASAQVSRYALNRQCVMIQDIGLQITCNGDVQGCHFRGR